jgi:hypothetical protein
MIDMGQADRTLRANPKSDDDGVFERHRARVKALLNLSELAMTTNQVEPITIAVEVKSVYGKPLYYPINESANLLAHIAGTETLTAQTLKLAKDMGMSIRLTHTVPDEVAGL